MDHDDVPQELSPQRPPSPHCYWQDLRDIIGYGANAQEAEENGVEVGVAGFAHLDPHDEEDDDFDEAVESLDPTEEGKEEGNGLSHGCCERCQQTGKMTWSCGSEDFPHYYCASCLFHYLRNEMGPFGKLEIVVRRSSSADNSNNNNNDAKMRASSREDRTVATDSSTVPSEEEENDGKKVKAHKRQPQPQTQTQTQGQEPYQLSFPGDLPCPRFADGECGCAAIPPSTIRAALQSSPKYKPLLLRYEASRQRHEAVIQEAVGEAPGDDDNDDDEEEKEDESASLLSSLRRDVAHALAQGVYVTCPSCGMHGHKSDGCMHMTCPCGTKYCYCCGGKRPCGCDSANAFIEYNPNWTNLPGRHASFGEESRDLKALHEFHRRRTAYFLRLVKERYPSDVWSQLQQVDPNVLSAVPTEGRSIDWNEVGGATMPVLGKRKPPTPSSPQQATVAGYDGMDPDEGILRPLDLEQGGEFGDEDGEGALASRPCCRQCLLVIRLLFNCVYQFVRAVLIWIAALVYTFLPMVQLFLVVTVLVREEWSWFSALILALSITFCCCFTTVFRVQGE